jgi:hypothetical protein
MTDRRIRDVQAQVAQIADVIHNHGPARSPEDHVRAGHILLANQVYADAARSFRAALSAKPASAEAHFGLALSLLQGRRPHLHSDATIRQIEGHLRASASLPEAHILELLVAEDHRLAWQRASHRIPKHIMEMARKLSGERTELILVHVPAPETRIWRALDRTRRKPS